MLPETIFVNDKEKKDKCFHSLQERRLAKEQGYADPINSNYDATSAMYYRVADFLLDNIQSGGAVGQVTFGSHNMDTVKYLLTKWVSSFTFTQVQGSDFNLIKNCFSLRGYSKVFTCFLWDEIAYSFI